MKRPLLFMCIWLVALVSIWMYLYDAPPFYEEIPIEEGEHIEIAGQIYQKEYRSYYGTNQVNLYLQSVKIKNSYTGQVLALNSKYKIICELNMDEMYRGKTVLMSDGIREEPKLGMEICVSGEWSCFKHASNPGEFDRADYYAAQNIIGEVDGDSIEIQGETFWRIREGLSDLRLFLKNRLYQVLPEKEASILAKMLLGERSGLDKNVKDLYQRNGIVHILSISGLHITMIGMGIYRLLRKCGCPMTVASIIGVIALLFYGTMTGFGVSSIRAVGMYLIRMTGIIMGRSYDLLTAAGILMTVMVCGNPRLIYQSGFLLSFGSVCAVGCLFPILPLKEVAAGKAPFLLPVWLRFILKRCRWIAEGLWASASISIFTLPIMLYYFYEVPLYSPFVNLMVLPFVGVIMVLGFVLMAVPEAALGTEFVRIILGGFERICLWFEQLPGHMWTTGRPAVWQIAVYYVGILGIVLLCSGKKDICGKKNRQSVKVCSAMKGCKIGFIFRKIIVGVRSKWWPCGIGVLVLFLGMDFSREDTVSFLAVGQGDCIVVMTETGKAYLFDGGSSSRKNIGEDIIVPFLKYHGISGLDGVFLSHPDEDHVNGIVELLEKQLIRIDRVYLPDVQQSCKEDFRELLHGAEQSVVYYSAGDYLKEGDLMITCVHPEENYQSETNEYSGCFLLENKNLKVLLTGDVEGRGEKALIESLKERSVDKVNVLKAAHHGSRYSTSKAFLEELDADLAVISCGEGNYYGHPHEDTLERLEEAKIPYCVTWERGCITVTEEGYSYFNKRKQRRKDE